MVAPDIAAKFGKFEFDYATTKYSSKNALALAKASKLAYFSKDDIADIVKNQWKFTYFQYFYESTRDAQAFLMANDQAIIISFQGTNSLINWMDDFDIFLTGGPFGKVHQGFLRQLYLLWREIEVTIEQLKMVARSQGKALSVWFTGHSLGAALATLAVAKLRERDQPVHGLYTFGSPRVGDRTFEQLFNVDFKARAFRFVNNNDSVTRVPGRVLGYSHVGTFFYLDKDGKIQIDPHYWYEFLDRIQGSLKDFLKPGTDGMKDHDMDRYIANLAKSTNLSFTLPG